MNWSNLTSGKLNKEELGEVGAIITLTYLFILFIVGLVGNAAILFVYGTKMKPSNHRVFILTLACLDLTGCLFGMPYAIAGIMYPYTFTDGLDCKLLMFVAFINYIGQVSSLILLLVIAIDRYRKMCVSQGRQITEKNARQLVVVVICIAVLLSWPLFMIYRENPIAIEQFNITGKRCNIDESVMANQTPIVLFHGVHFLTFIIGCTAIGILYYKIAKAISKAITVRRFTTEKEQSQYLKQKHITILFAATTTTAFIAYTPNIILSILDGVYESFSSSLSGGSIWAYRFFNISFFINNVANIFLYAGFDKRFRLNLANMFKCFKTGSA